MQSRVSRGLVAAALIAVLVPATAAYPQPSPELQTVQWHDLTFQLSTTWYRTVDFLPEGTRLTYGRVDGDHHLQLTIWPFEGRTGVAASEVANEAIEAKKKAASESPAISSWSSRMRTIGRADYLFLTERLTPTYAPGLLKDVSEVDIVPVDYDQRQRFYQVMLEDARPDNLPPAPLDDFEEIVSTLTVRPLGTVLLADDFMDANTGTLAAAGSTAHYQVGYQNGEFAILKSDTTWTKTYVARVGEETYADVALALDVRVTSADYGSVIDLYCRTSAAGDAYRAALDPIRGRASLERRTVDSTIQEIAPVTSSAAILTGTRVNHIELVCRGPVIALDVNGTRVVEARDIELAEGGLAIGGGAFVDAATMLSEVRFANLQVTQR